jgi:hypothetical protein
MSLPAGFVKECQGSVEFWTNRLRKDFKDDPKQIAFCNTIQAVLASLVEYVQTYHKTGLAFNPRGVSLAEAAIRLSDEPVQESDIQKSPAGHKRHPVMGNVVAAGNIAGLMGELAGRKSADGSSAATGLKHVGVDYLCVGCGACERASIGQGSRLVVNSHRHVRCSTNNR